MAPAIAHLTEDMDIPTRIPVGVVLAEEARMGMLLMVVK